MGLTVSAGEGVEGVGKEEGRKFFVRAGEGLRVWCGRGGGCCVEMGEGWWVRCRVGEGVGGFV